MAKLGFLKAYRELVSSGRKTTTLRRWKRPLVRTGQIVNSQGIGRLRVAAVEAVEWDRLTEADALADGFASLAELNRAVRRIYPHIEGDGRSWFKIRFRVLAVEEIAKPKRAKPRRAKAISGRVMANGPARASGTMSLRDKAKLARAVRQQPIGMGGQGFKSSKDQEFKGSYKDGSAMPLALEPLNS